MLILVHGFPLNQILDCFYLRLEFFATDQVLFFMPHRLTTPVQF